MSLDKLEYRRDWENSADFPTIEESEAQIRADLQYHPNVIRDFLNALIGQLEDLGVYDIARTDGTSMKYIRMTPDGLLETSVDGEDWVTTSSSGHVIVNADGKDMRQRRRLKFDNARVTDDGNQIIVHAPFDNADMAESDPESESYVRNRTHYLQIVQHYAKPIDNVRVSFSDGVASYTGMGNADIKPGVEYIVTWAGDTYKVTAQTYNGTTCLGDVGIFTKTVVTGEPFVFEMFTDAGCYIWRADYKSGNLNVTVERPELTELKKLDPMFLPGNVLAIDTALVGQTVAVAEVDETGRPVRWVAADPKKGEDGKDGKDGISATIKIEDIAGGHRLTFESASGTETIDVVDGKDGRDGKDGVSPTVSVTNITGGHRIAFSTDAGPVSVDVMDGKDGAAGQDGYSVFYCSDNTSWTSGVTRSISKSLFDLRDREARVGDFFVTAAGFLARITLVTETDIRGEQVVDMRGTNGKDGKDGKDGAMGASLHYSSEDNKYRAVGGTYSIPLTTMASGDIPVKSGDTVITADGHLSVIDTVGPVYCSALCVAYIIGPRGADGNDGSDGKDGKNGFSIFSSSDVNSFRQVGSVYSIPLSTIYKNGRDIAIGDLLVTADGHALRLTAIGDEHVSAYCFADLNGAPGQDGKDGQDGQDGKSPVRGIDYFTYTDQKEMVDAVISALGGDRFGVGENVTGKEFVVDGENVIAGLGAERFNAMSENLAIGDYSHAEGYNTRALGSYSHAEGIGSQATTLGAHAEGGSAIASGEHSHAEGQGTVASAGQAHAEGYSTEASGYASHAEGSATVASKKGAHAEGIGSKATGSGAHAEGDNTEALGIYSHAEGYRSIASGEYSHAGGRGTVASGRVAHAEGVSTTASGDYSHSEGHSTKATGVYSHAEGYLTEADGPSSHAEGYGTYAKQGHAEGRYNTKDLTNIIHVVGNGDSDESRSNAYTLDFDGNAWYAGGIVLGGAEYGKGSLSSTEFGLRVPGGHRGAEVGQLLRVKAVDERGRPSELEGVADDSVKSVNGVEPDEAGNVAIEVGAGSVKSVNGVEPDENGNVVIDVGAGSVTDWTDMPGPMPTGLLPDGVPYLVEAHVEEVLPEIQLTANSGTKGLDFIYTPVHVVPGWTYTVIHDGTEYQCEAYDDGGSYSLGSQGSGLPFTVVVYPNGRPGDTPTVYATVNNRGKNNVTFSIERRSEGEARKLRAELLPSEAVQSINGKTPDENGNVEIEAGGVSSWHDLADRPFYEESGFADIPFTYEWVDDECAITTPLGLEVGKSYIVTWKGVDYEVVGEDASAFADGLPAVGLGDVDGTTTTPFIVVGLGEEAASMFGIYGFADGDEADVPFSIKGEVTVIHKLDGKFLPDGVPYVESSMVEILPETTLAPDENDPSEYVLDADVSFTAGVTYIVTWNGTEYTCVSQDFSMAAPGAVAFGNLADTGAPDTGEPFSCIYVPGVGCSVLAQGESHDLTGVTMAIRGEVTVIHKLDPKFLPDGVPYVESGGFADIPFTYEWVDDECAITTPLGLEIGKSYIVTWNGVDYEVVGEDASEAVEGLPAVVLGDPDWTTAPFCIVGLGEEAASIVGTYGFAGGEEAGGPFSIKGEVAVIHKLDPRCLPDEVGVKLVDVPFVIESATASASASVTTTMTFAEIYEKVTSANTLVRGIATSELGTTVLNLGHYIESEIVFTYACPNGNSLEMVAISVKNDDTCRIVIATK